MVWSWRRCEYRDRFGERSGHGEPLSQTVRRACTPSLRWRSAPPCSRSRSSGTRSSTSTRRRPRFPRPSRPGSMIRSRSTWRRSSRSPEPPSSHVLPGLSVTASWLLGRSRWSFSPPTTGYACTSRPAACSPRCSTRSRWARSQAATSANSRSGSRAASCCRSPSYSAGAPARR
jgi:hypothetical protein